MLHLSEDMRKNFYLIENEINEYIARFEVCRFHRDNFLLLKNTQGQQVTERAEKSGVMFVGMV